ncbi:MAG: serine/threonine-protein kinase, partial [Myxococcota bacterium]
ERSHLALRSGDAGQVVVKYFLREARAAAALTHPNIVTVFDAGEQGGEYYMAMEYVEGETLKTLVRHNGAFHEKLLRFIVDRCCRGLGFAHERGIVHRDIKSGNIMLTRDKSLKIMDFGLAKFIEEYRSQHTQAIGTPFYMSPEQILGRDLDYRSDLYSLGVTLFECATGTVPFTKGELSYHHLHTPPPRPRDLNPKLSAKMEEMILRLLQKNPDDRYHAANELLKDLKRA